MDVAGRRILVVGVARSGLSAARLLAAKGAQVTANDKKTEADVLQSPLAAEFEEVRRLGVDFIFGAHPQEIFLNADLIVLSPGVPLTIPPLQQSRQAGLEIISE